MRRKLGITAAVEAARATGEQYMYMKVKALFDYVVLVGALEYVENMAMVTEEEWVVEL